MLLTDNNRIVSSRRSKLHGVAKANVRPLPHSTYGAHNDTISLVKDQFVYNFNIPSKHELYMIIIYLILKLNTLNK